MIIKHMALAASEKSSFRRLAEYITDPQEKDVRIGTVRVTNCISNDIDLAVLEIRNTQAQNTRASADRTYHLVVSFRDGEQPDDATLKTIEERICNALGFAGHQRISAVHHDTDNLHVHIAINKIHPSRYTIHEPFNAYYKLGQLAEKLEHDFGLEADNHTPSKTLAENRTADMERHSGVESLLGWLKRECRNQIEGAQSWEDMHQVMRENGLYLHERANGLVITAENGISVKASSVSRKFSKAKLEQRYGAFRPAPEHLAKVKPTRRYEKKPMAARINTVELYAQYRAVQVIASASRAEAWAKAKAKKDRLIEAAKRKGRLKRAAIKLVSASGIAKKLMYMATSKALKDEIDHINKAYRKERQERYTKFQRCTWADWLRDQAAKGDREALDALRARQGANGLKGNTVAGKGGPRAAETRAKQDVITKKGTIIYSAGASAVRDDGDKLKVSKGADEAGLQAALRLAMGKYGHRITVDGSAAFKEKIARVAASENLPLTFDDEALERRRQQLVNPSTTKEKDHGNDSSGRGPVSNRDEQARRAARANRDGATKSGTGHSFRYKPNPGKSAKAAPPAARNSVRSVSALGMVQQSKRGQGLLPGNVPGGMEHQGAQPDYGVRRPLHRAGRVGAAVANGGKSPVRQPPRILPNTRTRPPVKRTGRAPPLVTEDPSRLLSQPGSGSISEHQVPPAMPLATRPRVKRVGSAPSPASQGCLQRLSALGTVEIDSGVPTSTGPVAPATPIPGPTATHAVALHKEDAMVPVTTAAHGKKVERAAVKYIAEREQKRALGFDITKHVRYTQTDDRTAVYAGLRRVDGQALALLKAGEEVQVLPVDEATARRLKRIALGTLLSVSSKGTIKRKGRSR